MKRKLPSAWESLSWKDMNENHEPENPHHSTSWYPFYASWNEAPYLVKAFMQAESPPP